MTQDASLGPKPPKLTPLPPRPNAKCSIYKAHGPSSIARSARKGHQTPGTRRMDKAQNAVYKAVTTSKPKIKKSIIQNAGNKILDTWPKKDKAQDTTHKPRTKGATPKKLNYSDRAKERLTIRLAQFSKKGPF